MTASEPRDPAVGASSALLTDQYELTMVQAALRRGTATRRCAFEVFARRLPPGRRYGVVAGVARLLDLLTSFRFGTDELADLQRRGIVDDDTLAWLSDYSFEGDIDGYPEGECFLPYSPLLVVEGTFAEAVLLETLLLSVLNHDCAVAAAASRMISAAGERPCIEMGSRRTHERSAVAAARAAFIAGFASTSNLEAGRTYGIPTTGTAAHSFTLLHDDERDAFAAQVAALGPGTTLLVDTYDVAAGVRLAVEVAGTRLGAVRLDSGDLLSQARQVRALLDRLGASSTRIVVTSDLDEHAIAALATAPVDAYGVGTSLVVGSGAPTAGLVYKLVARAADDTADAALVSVAKRSQDKASVGGRKDAWRRLSPDGVAVAEVLGVRSVHEAAEQPPPRPAALRRSPPGGPVHLGWDRPLLVPLVRSGKIVAQEPLEAARLRHKRSLAELPAAAVRLSPGEPVIPTVFEAG